MSKKRREQILSATRGARSIRFADHEAAAIKTVALIRGEGFSTFVREAALKRTLRELEEILQLPRPQK